jgi:hypothetical protein
MFPLPHGFSAFIPYYRAINRSPKPIGKALASNPTSKSRPTQRSPAERAEFLAFRAELLRSGAPGLLEAKAVSEELVDGMTAELERVARDPNAVFFYSFIQARARAW